MPEASVRALIDTVPRASPEAYVVQAVQPALQGLPAITVSKSSIARHCVLREVFIENDIDDNDAGQSTPSRLSTSPLRSKRQISCAAGFVLNSPQGHSGGNFVPSFLIHSEAPPWDRLVLRVGREQSWPSARRA